MKVLTLNCGSSTLKFDVIEVGSGHSVRIASGKIDRIGEHASASLESESGPVEREAVARDHAEAFAAAMDLLDEAGRLQQIEAAGHRIVHGGPHFRSTVVIDDAVVEGIRAVNELAPLHNDRALAVLLAARERFPSLPMAAVFDTAFFADLPAAAAQYALPFDLAKRYEVRRYGFHGLAHAYMLSRMRAVSSRAPRRLITLQLGNGCSAAAILDGRPIDTSMGMTPLEGLVMGTRSGDLDPAVPLYLQQRTGMTAPEVETMLNTQSGLLGVSGRSSDMRDLLEAERAGDAAAALAIEIFCRRVTKYAGAYMALLGGLDALVFGGGIGENSPEVRSRVCEGLGWSGVRLDAGANQTAGKDDTVVSAEGSAAEVWVAHVDEAVTIAEETEQVAGAS